MGILTIGSAIPYVTFMRTYPGLPSAGLATSVPVYLYMVVSTPYKKDALGNSVGSLNSLMKDDMATWPA